MGYLDGVKDKLDMTDRGRVQINAHGQTSIDWLFVGGDIVVGPDVIHGIANGHQAAIGIDTFLTK